MGEKMAVRQILTEMNLQRLEEAEERVYGRPSVWDLVLKRRQEVPSARVREDVRKLEEDMKEIEEELKEVSESE